MGLAEWATYRLLGLGFHVASLLTGRCRGHIIEHTHRLKDRKVSWFVGGWEAWGGYGWLADEEERHGMLEHRKRQFGASNTFHSVHGRL